MLVTPGSYLGAAGEGYVRLALVPTEDDCAPRRRDPGGGAVNPELAEEIVAALDSGERRVASKVDDEWVVDVEAKEAILEYFRLRKVEPMEVGPFSYQDKIPLKRACAAACASFRPASPATARFSREGVVLMPGYVNIGAWVGPRTMVDTWATVGSCAQIGADVHLSGGVGIGGVLEPPQARPVIVEDGAFIGSRCIVDEGVRSAPGRCSRANVSLTASVPIIDVTGPGARRAPRRRPAPRSRRPGHAAEGVPGRHVRARLRADHRLAQESHRPKTSLNAVLREFELAV